MRRRLSSQEDDAEVNVTPLLDIVFIMLIFFIVTAVFVDEDGISPNLPEPNPEENESIPPPSLLLTVEEDGFIRVDDIRRVDPRSIKSVVEEFMARESDGIVVISALPDSRTGDTMTTLDQARLAAGPGRYDRITVTQAGAR